MLKAIITILITEMIKNVDPLNIKEILDKTVSGIRNVHIQKTYKEMAYTCGGIKYKTNEFINRNTIKMLLSVGLVCFLNVTKTNKIPLAKSIRVYSK